MWRESLGAYSIITEGKKGYRNHPAVKEFNGSVWHLFIRLEKIREEMLKRGYHPKELPGGGYYSGSLKVINSNTKPTPWQTLEEQITHLKSKGCKCDV